MRQIKSLRLLGVLLTLSLVCGCGVSAESTPRPLDPDAAPFRGVAQDPSPAPTGSGRVVVYLVRQDRLVAVVRRVPTGASAADVLAALLAGPTAREADAGLSTATPPGLRVMTAIGGTVTVDVPGQAPEAGRSDEVLGFAQVVLTLTAHDAAAVRFVRDGQTLDVPRADGSLTARPLVRDDYTSLL